MLEDKMPQHDREVVDKYIDPDESIEMSTYDYVVRPSANANTGPIIVVLPPVAEAKGRFYSVVVRDADAANTVTISDKDDSECWADVVFNSKCDAALFYSDGLFWHRLAEITSTFPSGYDYP